MSSNEAPSPEGGFDPVDARVDALLRDFFRAETPALLPPAPVESSDDWAALAPVEARPVSGGWRRDFAAPALLASVAVLFACGLWLLPRPGPGPGPGPGAQQVVQLPPKGKAVDEAIPAVWEPDVVGFPRRPTALQARSEWRKVDDGDVAVTVTDGDSLVDVKYYSTSIGPVEQRTNIEWTSVRVWRPERGEWVEATVPAVRVDVIPLGE